MYTLVNIAALILLDCFQGFEHNQNVQIIINMSATRGKGPVTAVTEVHLGKQQETKTLAGITGMVTISLEEET